MSDLWSQQPTPPPGLGACKASNARRVKCDASSGQSCWHCRIRDLPCKLLESGMGKSTHKKKGSQRSQDPATVFSSP
ncbi:hypothetical protein BDW66DRAFT_20103 [Aspergillus desertorum]